MLAAMFPASLLLPASCVFLLSRSNRKRTLRSKDLGFLFCGAAWMLLFFSLSSCKLPTYILPAIPLICLMIGVMLDQTVFRGDFDNRITAFLRPFPQRAGMTLLVAWVAIIGAEIWITREVSVGVVGLSVLCLTVAFVTYRLWGSELAFGAFGWAGSTVLALVIVAHASTRFVPIVSYNRSVYVKTQQMAQDHPDAPIVFFGDKPHAAQLNLPVSRMTYLPYDRKEAFAALMTRHDSVIVVTCDKQIESTRAAVADSHELILSEGERHLYLGLPVKTPDQRVALVDAEKTTQ